MDVASTKTQKQPSLIPIMLQNRSQNRNFNKSALNQSSTPSLTDSKPLPDFAPQQIFKEYFDTMSKHDSKVD